MSTPATKSLHRVAREMGILPTGTPSHVATEICREFHRLRGENIALGNALERANIRLDIMEGRIS